MNNKKGFTLVELLVVVVILGIITGLSIPLIRNIQSNNKDKEYLAYMDSLKYSAKLYVDSYGEDLFGRHKTGCALIKYRDMKEKGLLKDIPVDKVSCDSEETFVKVVKMDDKFGYAASIGCGSVDASGKVNVDIKLPKTGLSSSDVCSVDAKTIMSFTADPSSKDSINYKKYNINLKISSDTGINDNMVVYYGFSYNKDSNVINNDWRQLPVSVPGKKKQKEDILDGKTIDITTDKFTTPNNITGEVYLVLQIEKLENLSEDSWTTDPKQDKFLYFGPYKVDNTKPKFNDSTVISSENDFNSTKPKLKLKVTDEKYSTTNDLRMCISYDSDSCSTKLTDIRDNSKYEKYDANKVLPEIKDSYDGSSHTIYVTVSDAAGNYEKANYSYKLANRYTLTYDSNGGSACNPNTKVVTFNSEDEKTWGDLCRSTRTYYTFTGWNTKKDGTGTTITKDTKVTGNVKVFAQWRKNRVNFQFKVLDDGSLTSQTTDNSNVYNWTMDNNNIVNLNGKIYRPHIDYDATTMNLANHNNPNYLNITKNGYRGKPGEEWLCIEGCKTANQTFSQNNTSVTPSNICDYTNGDCTVTVKVNWVRMDVERQFAAVSNCGAQAYTVPADGDYMIELWGAAGYGVEGYDDGGKGAYVKGTIHLQQGEVLYFFIGGKGSTDYGYYSGSAPASCNGGGNAGGWLSCGGAGGGATDVRLFPGESGKICSDFIYINGRPHCYGDPWEDPASLKSRIMVAAGGGGTGCEGSRGGNGGIFEGERAQSVYHVGDGFGGTQTAGGSFSAKEYWGHSGRFGKGGGGNSNTDRDSNSYRGGGGGGGYYGGGGGSGAHPGGGGSSFVSGYAGFIAVNGNGNPKCASGSNSVACATHYSNKVFRDVSYSAGVNTEDGKAKITFVG